MNSEKKPDLKSPHPTNNTKARTRAANYFRASRFHIVLNPGEYPYFSMKYELFRKYTELMKYLLKFKSFRYCLSALGLNSEEHNNNKHLLHIHIYIEYKETTRLYISKVFGAHILTNIKEQLNVIQYVRDQELGIIEEIGTKALCHRPSIKEAEQMTIDELKELSINYSNIVDKIIQKKHKTSIDDFKKFNNCKVYYIYGPSGSGKTLKALEIMKEYGYKEFDNIQYNGHFYIGDCTGEGCCLYDDFRPSDMKVNEFIHFIDYNVHIMDIKGGKIFNKYNLIIITSIRNPNNIYNNCTDNEETNRQWLRRLNIINLN